MKKLLISPSKMTLGEQENQIYQNILKQSSELSLNLMAVKVENHPDDFLPWCYELLSASRDRMNYDLLRATAAYLYLKSYTISLFQLLAFYKLKHYV